MFKKIAETIPRPLWVEAESRVRYLDLYDKLLDGKFYDHLTTAFYDEAKNAGRVVKIAERRPSAQYHLPRMVARWCARKLFAGRHCPKLRHSSPDIAKECTKILNKAKFLSCMGEATMLGSVGSVAMTFRVIKESGREPQVSFKIWRAKFCEPCFDDMGELSSLRVAYLTTGIAFINLGWPLSDDFDVRNEYWFIRDWDNEREVTYQPVKKNDWNPVQGFLTQYDKKNRPMPKAELKEWDDLVFNHGLGFVPGHWFVNLAGGCAPDGACTFEDAIPNSIEIDFTLSQMGRGVRYNSAPQLVIQGNLMNVEPGEDAERSVSTVLQVQASTKSEDGDAYGEGKAYLLEMSGAGIDAGLKMIDGLKKYALEQIAASRKDPDRMKAPLSGRAMEYLDEDSNDLIMDLRTQYGEQGALPLAKKACLACGVLGDNSVGSLILEWPRLYQPTPDEIFALVQALALAMNPVQVPGPSVKSKSATGGTVEKPGAPMPSEEHQLLTPEQARAYLAMVLDVNMLDEETGEVLDQGGDERLRNPGSADEPTLAPKPLEMDDPRAQTESRGEMENSSEEFADAMTPM